MALRYCFPAFYATAYRPSTPSILAPGRSDGDGLGSVSRSLVSECRSRHTPDLQHLGKVGLDRPIRQQFRDRAEDLVRAEGEGLDDRGIGDPGHHQNGVQTGLDSGDDIGIHPVPDRPGDLRVRPIRLSAERNIIGFGLPTT